jgi:gluconolactonase
MDFLASGIEAIVTGLGITEGVVWHPRDRCLVFSDLTAGKVYRWTEADGPAVLRQPSNITNGNCIDGEGRIVSCEHATSSIVRFEPRYVKTLATHYRGKEFNSPNDVICDRSGRIWFTDPDFGRTNERVGVLREPQLGFKGVFRIEPDGSVTLIADDFETPNGLCLSADEGTLYVNDTQRAHIRRFAVQPDGSVRGGEVFAAIRSDDSGHPDGMKIDAEGRVWCTGAGGVHVLSAGGELLGEVRTQAKTRNFCFGGEDGATLFLAVDQMICRARLHAPAQ